MNVQSGKNYVTRNLDVRTIIDENLSSSILSTQTRQYNDYRIFIYGNYDSRQESSKDHLYKIDTDPRSDIGKYFISTLFQIMDYQKDLIVNTVTNTVVGDDEGFEILIDDAEENSVLLNYDNGYGNNIVVISCYNDDKIKILDKIKRLREKINKWSSILET